MSRMWLAWISLSLNCFISLPRASSASCEPRIPDDRVEVVERDQQALDDVVALLRSPQLVPRAPGDDVDLVIDVVADHLGQVERPRHAVDEREHDHAEAVLQLRVLVQLVEDDLRLAPRLSSTTRRGPRGRSSGP